MIDEKNVIQTHSLHTDYKNVLYSLCTLQKCQIAYVCSGRISSNAITWTCVNYIVKVDKDEGHAFWRDIGCVWKQLKFWQAIHQLCWPVIQILDELLNAQKTWYSLHETSKKPFWPNMSANFLHPLNCNGRLF